MIDERLILLIWPCALEGTFAGPFYLKYTRRRVECVVCSVDFTAVLDSALV